MPALPAAWCTYACMCVCELYNINNDYNVTWISHAHFLWESVQYSSFIVVFLNKEKEKQSMPVKDKYLYHIQYYGITAVKHVYMYVLCAHVSLMHASWYGPYTI